MKSLGIMQPYIFPYLGYFQLLNAVDEYVIYDDVQYIKGGWINRNNIQVGGNKVLVTFPLAAASANKMINETQLCDDLGKVEKTILMAYSRAPFFREASKVVKKIMAFNERNLAKFAANSICEIAAYLKIPTKILISSEIDRAKGADAQESVINICKKLGAGMYINAIGGKELYSKQDFEKVSIELKFLKPILNVYPQFPNREFMPGLSIVDVLMFNSVEEIQRLLKDYELI